eukprot:364531-Chlamydomonas_euryale.AAC.4
MNNTPINTCIEIHSQAVIHIHAGPASTLSPPKLLNTRPPKLLNTQALKCPSPPALEHPHSCMPISPSSWTCKLLTPIPPKLLNTPPSS